MAELHEGTCHGGPLNGKRGMSRNPKGFLLVDRVAGRAWLYKRAESGDFHVCPDPGTRGETRRLDMSRAVDAALEPDYDVRSVAHPEGL